MSALMIFLLVAAAATVVTGLASWAYLTWDHYRERQRYIQLAGSVTQLRHPRAQRHWSSHDDRSSNR